MRRHIKFIPFLFCFLGSYLVSVAADPVPFPFTDFLRIVKDFHPVSKQAQLSNEMAGLAARSARGTFDPLLHSDYTKKTYAGKLYYGYFDNYLKIPAWIGEVSAGYENNTGLNQNPSDYTPPGGLGYVAYTLPIGQGILIDYRRAAVKQAQLTSQMGLVERTKAVNKLLYDAAYAYWDWYYSYQKFLAIQNSQANAVDNFNMVKSAISAGDASLIDSVESTLLMYERTADLQQAETDLLNARLLASNYLWDANNLPREMSDQLMPFPDSTMLNVNQALSPQFLTDALPLHPDLNKIDLKLKSLAIDKRLARDNMLPNVDLTGKLLTRGFDIPSNLDGNYIANYNKIMLNINQPLFIRKERAKFQETKLKLSQATWEQQLLKLETTNNIKASQNKLNNYLRNKDTQQKATLNYMKVRDAEVTKYNAGEGNLLKINFYDSKAIEATLKNIKVNTEVYKAYCELYYKSGKMAELSQ